MKKLIIATIMTLGLGYVAINALIPTTEDKLMDKVAYRNMLLKNQEGGLVNYEDKLIKLEEEIQQLHKQLAEENQKKRMRG